MALVVNTNIASMNAQRSLAANTSDMKQAMERLSTGKKINSAADDAAGFAIAETMTSQIRGLNMAAKNASDGLGLLKVIENATNDVTDMLQRVRELTVQAKSNTNGPSDVERLQAEADALFEEITRVADYTTYNDVAYLGAEFGTVNIQVGYKDGEVIKLNTFNIDALTLGLENVTTAAVSRVDIISQSSGYGTIADYSGQFTISAGGNAVVIDYPTDGTGAPADLDALINDIQTSDYYNPGLGFTVQKTTDGLGGEFIEVTHTAGAHASQVQLSYQSGAGGSTTNTATNISTTQEGADSVTQYLQIKDGNSLEKITDAINIVAGHKAQWGAGQNRLEYTISNLMNVVEFTAAARSRIQDADFAVEAANLAKAQVLQQTGAAMLAQANAAPQLALQLLK